MSPGGGRVSTRWLCLHKGTVSPQNRLCLYKIDCVSTRLTVPTQGWLCLHKVDCVPTRWACLHIVDCVPKRWTCPHKMDCVSTSGLCLHKVDSTRLTVPTRGGLCLHRVDLVSRRLRLRTAKTVHGASVHTQEKYNPKIQPNGQCQIDRENY